MDDAAHLEREVAADGRAQRAVGVLLGGSPGRGGAAARRAGSGSVRGEHGRRGGGSGEGGVRRVVCCFDVVEETGSEERRSREDMTLVVLVVSRKTHVGQAVWNRLDKAPGARPKPRLLRWVGLGLRGTGGGSSAEIDGMRGLMHLSRAQKPP